MINKTQKCVIYFNSVQQNLKIFMKRISPYFIFWWQNILSVLGLFFAFCTCAYMVSVSSAYEKMFPAVFVWTTSFIYMMNRTGPNVYPCGIPYSTLVPPLTIFNILTCCMQFVIDNLQIILMEVCLSHLAWNVFFSLLWLTVSNGLAKLKDTPNAFFLHSYI